MFPLDLCPWVVFLSIFWGLHPFPSCGLESSPKPWNKATNARTGTLLGCASGGCFVRVISLPCTHSGRALPHCRLGLTPCLTGLASEAQAGLVGHSAQFLPALG